MTKKSMEAISKNAPHWAALIIIVLAFLIYMERQSDKGDLLADQRIATCHRVQEDTVTILRSLNSSILEARVEDAKLHKSIEDMLDAMRSHMSAHKGGF